MRHFDNVVRMKERDGECVKIKYMQCTRRAREQQDEEAFLFTLALEVRFLGVERRFMDCGEMVSRTRTRDYFTLIINFNYSLTHSQF